MKKRIYRIVFKWSIRPLKYNPVYSTCDMQVEIFWRQTTISFIKSKLLFCWVYSNVWLFFRNETFHFALLCIYWSSINVLISVKRFRPHQCKNIVRFVRSQGPVNSDCCEIIPRTWCITSREQFYKPGATGNLIYCWRLLVSRWKLNSKGRPVPSER